MAEQETIATPSVGSMYDFNEDIVLQFGQFGLSNAVKGLMDVEEGPGIYEDLRKMLA